MNPLKKIWKWKLRNWKALLLSAVLLFVLLELVARFALGLGDIPVYVEDGEFEYIYAPYQDVWRFGNHITTNEYGMRSNEVDGSAKVTILKMGDSVINGGAHVDHNDLSSTIIGDSLASEFGADVQVLNISAGSWGPDNAFAFIEKYGDFNASMIVLVFSSHDYHDNRHFQTVVGEHPSWPARKPMLAVTDGFGRYVWPRIKAIFGKKETYDYLAGHDDSPVNQGWQQFFEHCSAHDIELLVYVHPTKAENASGSYDDNGQRLITMLEEAGVAYQLGLGDYEATDYRDDIHTLAGGHRKLVASLYEPIRTHVLTQID